jgi:asparagine synthase (glutamine-hydrolysing)
MCGIFAYIGNKHKVSLIKDQFELGKSRGPESSKFLSIHQNIYFGFHRLAINGLDEISNQPFEISGVYLICNGEIYNYRSLYEKINITGSTNSDCEIIVHMYLKYGIEYLLDSLDGVFAFILYDSNINKVFVARDPYGVRPLYYINDHGIMAFASELKQLKNFDFNTGHFDCFDFTSKHFLPGTFMEIKLLNNDTSDNDIPKLIYSFIYYKKIVLNTKIKKYSSFGFGNISVFDPKGNISVSDPKGNISVSDPKGNVNLDDSNYYSSIYKYLYQAVKKRVVGTTERPIACLLSGGLDSSTITAMVNSFLPKGVLETYSIGLPNSTDLIYAGKVAKHLGTKHTEIVLTEEEFFDAIPEVIREIESYDTTTVRASVGNYLIGKYIRKNSQAKVIFNGDGADELMGGYRYFKLTKDPLEFDKECKRLLSDIYLFDVLRSDKSISSNGLEPRTPFLDRSFVQYYLSISPEIRCHSINGFCEKYLLRKSIETENNSLLPTEVLWRTKEAFSDGVSGLDRSWYEVIHEKLMGHNSLSEKSGIELEREYYMKIFEEYFPNKCDILPYFWMPKYISVNDPSARLIN